ncbi:hypothetical protein ElyMa_005522700 [Elysia marginata]|uniref:Uncharacterized protein n=1 Tax=Elysia marginata TaxID=1093978 RepID=A0AAV4EWR8_9GAST|nr:hypothetical protein ElyMa_005522700 [Elysia marginata]
MEQIWHRADRTKQRIRIKLYNTLVRPEVGFVDVHLVALNDVPLQRRIPLEQDRIGPLRGRPQVDGLIRHWGQKIEKHTRVSKLD